MKIHEIKKLGYAKDYQNCVIGYSYYEVSKTFNRAKPNCTKAKVDEVLNCWNKYDSICPADETPLLAAALRVGNKAYILECGGDSDTYGNLMQELETWMAMNNSWDI